MRSRRRGRRRMVEGASKVMERAGRKIWSWLENIWLLADDDDLTRSCSILMKLEKM